MAEAVQEGDVHKEPDHPPREAAQSNAVELHDGVEPAQGRGAADVAILEREVTGVALQPTANRVGGMEAALHATSHTPGRLLIDAMSPTAKTSG